MQKSFSFTVFFIACGLVACGLLHGQDSLTLSSGNATAGGSVTLTLTLANQSAATSPGALQWAITYPGGSVSSMTAAAGAAAAGMTVTCAQAPAGYSCVLWGMNANVIGSGVVASLTFNLTATASTFQVTLGGVAGSSPSGEPVALSATSGAVTVGSAGSGSGGGSGSGSGGSGSGSGSGSSDPPNVSSFGCTPSSVTGGSPSVCTINLSTAAPTGGINVALSSSQPSVSVPATLNISAGASTGSFQATTSAVAAAVVGTLTATYNGSSQIASLTVTPPGSTISSVSCAPATVTGGASSTCTATLSASASSSGASISLTSNSAHVTVPATLTITAGQTTGTFAATTTSVASVTAVTITATLNSLQHTATLTLDPAGQLSALTCTLPLVSKMPVMPNNSSATCTVTLSAPASVAEAIALASNASVLTVPASVTVPSGATSATFTASSGTFSSADQEVSITATAGTSQETYSLLLHILPSSIACAPAAIMAPASPTTTCTITLTQASPSAATVSLEASNSNLTVPSSVTIAAGHNSATFAGTTTSSAPYSVITLQASWATSVSATVSVGPVPVKSVSCNPSTVTPGKTATCTLTLVAPSPAGGETVTTTSGNKSLSVPASVTVAAGATTANFTATALTGYAASSVQITASVSGTSASTAVADAREGPAPAHSSGTPAPIGALRAGDRPGAAGNPARAIVVSAAAAPLVGDVAPQLSCAPQDVEPGGTVTCEVQLGTASASGTELSVSSSHSSLHVPARIMSRPNQSSVSFQASLDADAPPQTMAIQVALGSPGTSDSNAAQSQIAVQPGTLPVVNAPSAQKTPFGAKLSFRVTAASGSGRALAVRADRLPPGAAFDPTTGDFEWTASPAQPGWWETIFTTTDELGRSATAKVPIQAGSGGPEIDLVENAASGSREVVCASGSLARIRGAWLANGSASDFTGSVTSLAGTRVLVNGQTTPVVSVSPTEVTFVCPRTEGSAMAVSVETAMAVSAPATAAVAASAPGIFTTDGSGSGQATATIFEGSRLAMPRNHRYPSQPAQAGDNLSILMTGVAVDADPSMLAVRIGDVETHAISVRAVAGAAGVVQVELTIPGAAPLGDAVPIRVRQGLPGTGVRESQTATIAIESSR